MLDLRKPNDIEKYAQDLATIKSLLLEVDEKPFIESWAMFSWGGLLIAGTIAHYIIHHVLGLGLSDILLRLWLPVWLLATFLDTIAHVKWFSRESIPFLSRPMVKAWLFAAGCTIGWAFTMFLFIKVDGIRYLPQLILVYCGVMFMLYAYISYIALNVFGFFLIATAIILHLTGLALDIQFLAAGILLGITYLSSGILMRIKEKEAHG